MAPRIAALCFGLGLLLFVIFLYMRMEEEGCDYGCLTASHKSELDFLTCKDKCDKMDAADMSASSWGHVSCGNHDADSCEECPQGNGGAWCHGDCEWVPGKCLLQPSGYRERCRQQCGKTLPDSEKIKDNETLCLSRCYHSRNEWDFLLALVGALVWLPMVPLIAGFPGSCHCCISAQRCTSSLVFSTPGWILYIVSCIMVFVMVFVPSDAIFVTLYILVALLAVASMGTARLLYFKEQEKIEMGLTKPNTEASVIGNGGVGPAVYDLQLQVMDLAGKVRGLEKFVNMPYSMSKEGSEVEFQHLTRDTHQGGFVPPAPPMSGDTNCV